MSEIRDRYLSNDYIEKNPTWDMQDSAWKAGHVASILDAAAIDPGRICEVGCGAGKVLSSLAGRYPNSSFVGYDIAPAAAKFWQDFDASRIELKVGNFFELDDAHYDVLLLLDVLEHVADPHSFLSGLHGRSDHLVLHFPLDLSAINVLRESPLLYVRRKVGHIHYFTKGLALELIKECGFEVLDSRFTGAAFNTPQATIRTRMAQIPRRIASLLGQDMGARLLGGETLMVLARPK